MSDALILAIDQGTTNSKAILVNAFGEVTTSANAPVPIYHPKDGWVEQDPEEIWESVVRAVCACVARFDTSRIIGVGISSQRESVLAWHASTGKPLGPCISWQCRRTAEVCAGLKDAGYEEVVRRKTGLPLDPMFPATKIAWLLANIQAEASSVQFSNVHIGTVDSWILWRLTGGKRFACDASNAARTQLFDLRTLTWDDELTKLFAVPKTVLPDVRPSDAAFGTTCGVPGLPDGLIIHAMIGDSHAALFGYGVTEPGTVKATYGTGSSLMTPVLNLVEPQAGITTTIAWMQGGNPTYALEGNILVSASSLPWASNTLGLGGSPQALADLAKTVVDNAGVFFVPAFVGLGAPYWDSDARATFTGISFKSSRAHLARAVLEGLAFQITDVFTAMNEQLASPLTTLLADGGASQNTFLMQLQANQLGCPVLTRDVPEASALGAALMAGIALGLWRSSDDLSALKSRRAPTVPQITAEERLRQRSLWQLAVAQTRFAPMRAVK